MYLKKIIAHGFKSFADNTIIELNKNIAGIVGPNGSGKSNVVDAIRWVLGEQSVKSLRGEGNMTDVIFSGSKSRNPMNVASVTLVFDNTDRYLNMDYDEVSIKRRLYNDGTNEFFINNDKVRLKDVSDIFLDSGVSKESFNIIGQGKIEEIIASKPSDRRIIFEEAAGVLKYKKRKEEAIRKLDKTHDNMDRVNDIINELEKQVEPLRDQKVKALRYLDLKDELKDLEVSLIAKDITDINLVYQENKKEIEKLNAEILNLSTQSTSNEVKIEEYKGKLNNIEQKLNELNRLLLLKTEEVEKLNSQKNIITERKKYEVSNQLLHDSIVQLKEEELKLSNEINSYKLEKETSTNKLQEISFKIENLNKEINLNNQEKNKFTSKLNELVRTANVIRLKKDSLEESIESNSNLPYAVKMVLNNPKLKGVHTTIGNAIEVSEEYSKAISIAIGASATNVIVDNENVAKEAISYLKTNNYGRVTFFPISIIKDKCIDKETLMLIEQEAGFIDIASNLVKYHDIYKNIIKNILGNVIVVNDINTANRISKLIQYRYRIVTLEGEILHVGGSLTGGNATVRNIITDKYELDKLKYKEKKNNEEIKTVEEQLNEIDNKSSALDDKSYLANKEKNELINYISIQDNTIKDLLIRLNKVKEDINGTNNMMDGTLSEEENKVIDAYYIAINDKNKITNEINEVNNYKLKLNNEMEEFNYSIKKENSLYNEKNNHLKELEISVNRMDVKLDNLLNNLNENYSLTYEKAISLYKLEIDSNIARNKVNALKREMKELEPVNLAAPEEYDRISTRYEFLIKQQEDLTKAENTLLEIIADMDSVMKDEFMKTYELINQNFEQTFRELFKGGHAELKLTDQSNILETGIEIIASPPGKSLKSINLLSGGEKTFTAISLLFAILKSRPVPFCVLDEVEAALDEVNVDSFGEYVTKLKDKTQFIIITHKKKTMEYADLLYGITMQESGVSKLVSVKLEEIA